MSESIATFPQPRTVSPVPGRTRALVLGVLIGLIVGVLGFAAVKPTVGAIRVALSGEDPAVAEATVEYPARELPREWRWERKGVEYEHMYRKHDSPRLDWIRDRGSR